MESRITVILGLFALMFACEQEPVAEPPKLPTLLEYDLSLDESAEVQAWKQEALALATALANPPNPKALDRYEENLRSALTSPYRVARDNLGVMKRRGDTGTSAKPLAMEHAHAMLIPVMDEIAKLPIIYDRVLIWVAMEGDRSFLDLEVGKRTDAGKLAEVQQLLSQLPYNLTQQR
jgi:hypothetical protein